MKRPDIWNVNKLRMSDLAVRLWKLFNDMLLSWLADEIIKIYKNRYFLSQSESEFTVGSVQSREANSRVQSPPLARSQIGQRNQSQVYIFICLPYRVSCHFYVITVYLSSSLSHVADDNCYCMKCYRQK